MLLRLTLVAALCAALSRPAAAQEPEPAGAPEPSPDIELSPEEVERARNHFMAGTAYYEDGRWDEAAEEFEEAYRITGHPDVLYNLGQAHDRMDRREEAIEAYRGYLDRAEEPPDRERVERRIRELEQLMAAEQEASSPPVAEAPAPAPPSSPSAPPDDGFGFWPWVAIGAGGAMALGAAITGGLALAKHGDLEDACGPDGRSCPPGSQDDIDAGNALAAWSTVLTVGAVLAAGAGVTLLVLDAQGADEEAAPAATVELLPGPVPAGASARVRF